MVTMLLLGNGGTGAGTRSGSWGDGYGRWFNYKFRHGLNSWCLCCSKRKHNTGSLQVVMQLKQEMSSMEFGMLNIQQAQFLFGYSQILPSDSGVTAVQLKLQLLLRLLEQQVVSSKKHKCRLRLT